MNDDKKQHDWMKATPNNRNADPILRAWIKEINELKTTIVNDRTSHNNNVHELTKIFRTAFEKIEGFDKKLDEIVGNFHTLEIKVTKHDERINFLLRFVSPVAILSLISTILLIIFRR